MNRCRATRSILVMKTNFSTASALEASVTPFAQATRGAWGRHFTGHRQYRNYSNHLPILLHNNDSLYTIDSNSFGSRFNSHKRSSLSPFCDGLYSNPFVVFASHRDSSNADECQYPISRVRRAFCHSSIALGASGLEEDSGIDALGFCCLLKALPILADVFITRCGVQNSAFADVALILFTRCPRVASQDGRFA